MLILGFFSGYLFVSIMESLMHDYVHHARQGFQKLQFRFPRFLDPFRAARRSHTQVHHGQTFHSHVVQFKDFAHKAKLDRLLVGAEGQRIIRESYGTTINLRSTVMFILPLLPVLVPVLFGMPGLFAAGFLIPTLIYPLMSRVFHPYLHLSYVEALAKASLPVRSLLKTSYFRKVWRHHYLHHRYPRTNFNLLLGGDTLRGVQRTPGYADLKLMSALGIPLH